MSEQMLNLRGPGRWDGVACMVGNRDALEALRDAITTAIDTGAGGATFYCSDGEEYVLAIALEDEMDTVQCAYNGELAPQRSLREIVPMYAVRNFPPALRKAQARFNASPSNSRCVEDDEH